MGKQDFTLVNNTGFPIYKVFVSAANDDSWEEDILGRGVMAQGESVEITFDRATDADLWDLKVVDENADEFVWKGFDLSTISEITIHWDGETTSATWE